MGFSATHGATVGGRKRPEYTAWIRMKHRCYNPANKDFSIYGGRGIIVCDEWRNDFTAFVKHIGERPSPLHSLDRIDSNGNYEPGNVKWSLPVQQSRNRRYVHRATVNGETLTISEWAERIGVKRSAIYARIVNYGYTPEEAVTLKFGDGRFKPGHNRHV